MTNTPSSKPRRLALDHWPALPIAIWWEWDQLSPKHEDDVAAALEHPDRIYEIKLVMSNSIMEKSVAWVEASFPALEILHLTSYHYDPMVLPDAFLAASTPSAIPHRLLHVKLTNVYFPTFPQLLLSSRDLVSLSLRSDRDVITTFLSPEAITSALSAASQLKNLSLRLSDENDGIQGSIHLPSPNHILLPALNEFCFHGPGDYLEDFVSRIHPPLLEQLNVYLRWPHVVDFPQLSNFINRTEQLSSLPHLTSIKLGDGEFQIRHCFRHRPSRQRVVRLQLDIWLDWQVSQVHHVCKQLSPLMSSVEQLVIAASYSPTRLQGETKPASWLRLFEPFHGVQELELSTHKDQGTQISHALEQTTWEGVQEVFPALHSLWLCDFETRAWSVINSFVFLRQVDGRQVTTHRSKSLPCIEEFRSESLID